MTAKEHLEKAATIVSGDRQRDYGHPKDNHACTAALFEAYMARRGGPVDAEAVCMFNVLQKVARLANTPGHADSITDIIGYALNVAMLKEDTGVNNAH
jgi:hypothetical protein